MDGELDFLTTLNYKPESRCGVYHCTLLVGEHNVELINGEWDWENVVHYNEYERVGFYAPMPEEWRDA